jgi:hypothetical protein
MAGYLVKRGRTTNLAVAKPHKKPLGKFDCDMLDLQWVTDCQADNGNLKRQRAAVGVYTSYTGFAVLAAGSVPP